MSSGKNNNKGQNAAQVPAAVQGSISDPLSPHQVVKKAEVVAEIEGGAPTHAGGHAQVASKAQIDGQTVPAAVQGDISDPLSPHQVAAKKEVVAEIDGQGVHSTTGRVAAAAEDTASTIADRAAGAKDSLIAMAVAAKDSIVHGAVATAEAVQHAGAVVSEKAAAALPVIQEKAAATGAVISEKAVAAGQSVVGAAQTAGHAVQERTAAAIPVIQEKAAATGAVLQDKAAAARDYVAETGATAGAVVQEKAVAAKDYVAGSIPVVQEKAAAAGAKVQEKAAAAGATIQQKAAAAGSVVQDKAVAAKDYVVGGTAAHADTGVSLYCHVLRCWEYTPCAVHGPAPHFTAGLHTQSAAELEEAHKNADARRAAILAEKVATAAKMADVAPVQQRKSSLKSHQSTDVPRGNELPRDSASAASSNANVASSNANAASSK